MDSRSEHLFPGGNPAGRCPPITADYTADSTGTALGHTLMINDPKSLLATPLLTLLHSLIMITSMIL